MSTLSVRNPTLLDLAKRLDPNGAIASIAEILNQTNPILDDMVFKEGNLPTGHRGTIRSGLPTPTWRKLYGGVQPSKSTTIQVTDTCGMLEAYAECDKALADLSGNAAAFRLSEDVGFIESMSQEMAGSLFYANEATEPEAFTGFAPRFNDYTAQNGSNIIRQDPSSAADGSDNSSVWLVVWGDHVHGIYPKGSKAGISMTDKGQVTVENADGNGGRMEAYRTHYRWDNGLHVKDWRYISRAQFNAEDLTKNASTGPDLIDMMAQMLDVIPNLDAGRPVFYANRNTMSFLRRQLMNKMANSTLSMEQITRPNGALARVLAFSGIPVRRCDAITNTEAGV